MGPCISILRDIAQALQEPQNANDASTNPGAPTPGTNFTPVTPAAPHVDSNITPTPAAPIHIAAPTPMAPIHGNDEVSPIYKNLPSDAEQFRVRNVYDGDTLTLVDERRVRLLGIDCPEVKEKQAFSQEAKEYTKQKCHQKDIWISFQANSEKADHYGRLLAFVWVEENNGYLCVNEGIVGAGLASVYKPNTDAKVSNWDKLLALQSQARVGKKGLWSTFEDYTVVKTSNGSAYHKRECEHVAKSRVTELKASEAAKLGLHPCRTCLADA